MTCPGSQSRVGQVDVSGFVSRFLRLLSGLSELTVRVPVRLRTRTTGGHVGSPCPRSLCPGSSSETTAGLLSARLRRLAAAPGHLFRNTPEPFRFHE
jgi:hypothetical protein